MKKDLFVLALLLTVFTASIAGCSKYDDMNPDSESLDISGSDITNSEIADYGTEIIVEEFVVMSEEEFLADRNHEKPEEGYNTLQDIKLIADEVLPSSIGFGGVDLSERSLRYIWISNGS